MDKCDLSFMDDFNVLNKEQIKSIFDEKIEYLVCIDDLENEVLSGTEGSTKKTYLQVDFESCDPLNLASGLTCMQKEELDLYLEKYYMQVLTTNSQIDYDDIDDPLKTIFDFKIGFKLN